MKNPNSVKEALRAFKDYTLLYTFKDGDTVFVLNPFGGGICATQQLKLPEDWEITEDKLDRIKMIKK